MSTVPGRSPEGGRLALQDPIESGRDRFTHHLKPAINLAARSGEFARVVRTYKDVLTEVTDRRIDPDIVNSAFGVIAMQSLKSGMGEEATELIPELNAAMAAESRKLFAWFSQNYGGVTSLLSSHVDANSDVQQAFVEQVGSNLAHWIAVNRSLARGARTAVSDRNHQEVIMSTIGEGQIKSMAAFLLNNSRNNQFRNLGERIPQTNPLVTDNLDALAESARVNVEILRLNGYARDFEIRDWLATTGREAREGRKIYLTPFYTRLVKELHFQTERKNGLGGVILFGDPGTGKTEVLREKNRQQGFETRVINIHHYTSFNELIADKAMQLGLDKGASMAQKLDIVCKNFAEMDPEQFEATCYGMLDKLKAEGKVPQDETIGNFMKSFVGTEVYDLLDNLEPGANWKLFRDSFITRQRARILRTSLGDSQQESGEDIVRGEILLAIQKGERVVLDEVDKAGPGALSGILSFLAKSPGEHFAYGQQDIQIPYWFAIDATTNSLQLDSYLTDRFVPRKVNTPPVLDQLMIAGVRVSDTEGNILLSPQEQNQLVWFYTYIVPEVNLLLGEFNQRKGKDEAGLSPLSNRRIQEFTGYLVNFGAKRRTDRSFAEATHAFLLENPLWSNDPELARQMEGLLGKYSGIIGGSESSLTDYSTLPPAFDRAAQKKAALGRVVNSPLINAVRVLTHEESDTFKPRLITLTPGQVAVVKEAVFAKRDVRARGDELDLPIGLELFEDKRNAGQAWLGLRYLPEGSAEKILMRTDIGAEGKILAASSDGRVIVMSSPADQGENLTVRSSFRSSDKSEVKTIKVPSGSEVQTDDRANYVARKTGDTVFIFRSRSLDQPLHTISKAKRFEISRNGQFVLVEYTSGESKVMSTRSAHGSTEALPNMGGSWEFAGDNLVVCKNLDQSVAPQAVFLG